MFKRFRQLRISLAAKFQILFGAAVVLIIGAALWVPWQRMEQLMDQFNQHAAQTLAQQAIADHQAIAWANQESHPVSLDGAISTAMDATRLMSATARGTTQPFSPPASRPSGPILIGIETATGPTATALTRFERAAFAKFQADPDLPFESQNYMRSGNARFRFAMRLSLESSCLPCHAGAGNSKDSLAQGPATRIATASPSPMAANLPATAASAESPSPRLLGIISVDLPSQIDAGQQQLNRLYIFLAGLTAGLFAIAVFYLITTRLILEPVRVLRETAEKVGQGDLNIRSDINTGDEFQQLSESFNTMLANLKDSADQLRAINKTLDLKLGEIAASNVALFESNRLKSEFLANVSHELRTPLNSILGFAELLRDSISPGSAGAIGSNGPSPLPSPTGDAKSVRYIQNIVNSGRNLLELINDLLDLAKIEAGRMEVRSEPLSLGDLFEGLVALLKPLTEAKGVTIVATTSPDVPIIQSDPAKLQQVLYNLLSNAIKFSPAQGHIELTARRVDGSSVRISVTDRGPGIQPDQHHLIFEKFRQVDGSVTREHSGTGLGLAIARDLTNLLGGTIAVDSEPGHGATFWIQLPLRIQSGPRDVRGGMVMT